MNHRFLIIGLAVIGLIPALAIALLIRLEDGQLIVAGQAMAEYDLARLSAGLLSTMKPIWLLAAPAMAFGRERVDPLYWGTVFAAPFILLGPSLLAGLAVGGSGFVTPVAAMSLLGLMTLCFVLWNRVLEKLWGISPAILIYGLVWAASGYLGYLTEYIIPYLELPLLKGLTWLSWLLPQLQSGPDAVDAALQTGAFEMSPILPTLIQIPVLAVSAWYVEKKRS